MNQGPIWGQFMKKNSGQKSRATVPLKQYLFPPPSENDIFPPLTTPCFSTPIVAFWVGTVINSKFQYFFRLTFWKP